MKRTAAMIAVALACALGATGAWAAGPGRAGAQRTCTTARCLFTDENGDGLCDNRTDGTCRYDADGDGVCDRTGQGRYFVDENGDGVCDNRGTGCHGNGWGRRA